ncbi:putative Late nodulin [Medicago truncatula]|uniref:Putative Late nodulin n=1 Tax=Medicago truncatula TaxID=3880 RepID=A0A396HL58_MEDTR|nr:putative Late nodulin [Medicago truncatula]
MAQILMFVSVLIIFLSLFLADTKQTNIPCENKRDCPQPLYPKFVTCFEGLCRMHYPLKKF